MIPGEQLVRGAVERKGVVEVYHRLSVIGCYKDRSMPHLHDLKYKAPGR